jgi:uncharacterized protein (DUF169 family)
MKPSEFAVVVGRYLKLPTFPIGFKLVRSEKEVPSKAKKFEGLTICQIYNMARRYRWTVYFDMRTTCPIGLVAYGLAEPDEAYSSGKLAVNAGYAVNEEIGVEFERAVPKLEYGKYAGCVVSPLERDEIIPDFAVIYGNPAQILRLVHAALYKKGGKLETFILGRASCAEYLGALIDRTPRFVLPCYGDRVFGLTQDDEVAFAFPFEIADEIAEGLEATHRKGIRFPIPATGLRVEPILPESYMESVKNMKNKIERKSK